MEWLQGDHLTLKRNPNCWLRGRPYFDGMLTSVITDPQAMVARFEGGDLDAAILPANDLP